MPPPTSKPAALTLLQGVGLQTLSHLDSFEVRIAPCNALPEIGSHVILAHTKCQFSGTLLAIKSTRDSKRPVTLHVYSPMQRLAFTNNYRTWTNKTAIDVIEDVLTSHAIPHKRILLNEYPRRFTMQYGESDLAFIQNLMDATRIFFFVDNDARVVLCDRSPAFARQTTATPLKDSEVGDLEIIRQLVPDMALELSSSNINPLALQDMYLVGVAKLPLRPGSVILVENDKYFVIMVQHAVSELEYSNTFWAIPADKQYRMPVRSHSHTSWSQITLATGTSLKSRTSNNTQTPLPPHSTYPDRVALMLPSRDPFAKDNEHSIISMDMAKDKEALQLQIPGEIRGAASGECHLSFLKSLTLRVHDLIASTIGKLVLAVTGKATISANEIVLDAKSKLTLKSKAIIIKGDKVFINSDNKATPGEADEASDPTLPSFRGHDKTPEQAG